MSIEDDKSILVHITPLNSKRKALACEKESGYIKTVIRVIDMIAHPIGTAGAGRDNGERATSAQTVNFETSGGTGYISMVPVLMVCMRKKSSSESNNVPERHQK